MKIVYGYTKDVQPYFQHVPIEEGEVGLFYKGFDLMTPHFFEETVASFAPELGCQYLLAMEQDEVIGVLKWKRYGLPNHQYVTEEEAKNVDNYIAIRLVDVKQNARQNGVAKQLVQALSERLNEEDVIVGGKATPMGEKTRIHEWMANNVRQPYHKSEITLVKQWERKHLY